jgi:excisionase family DNA binding protein
MSHEPNDEHELSVMTAEQVAAYLQVGKRTVYNMAAAGEMPAAKVGEQWRFYRPEIDH